MVSFCPVHLHSFSLSVCVVLLLLFFLLFFFINYTGSCQLLSTQNETTMKQRAAAKKRRRKGQPETRTGGKETPNSQPAIHDVEGADSKRAAAEHTEADRVRLNAQLAVAGQMAGIGRPFQGSGAHALALNQSHLLPAGLADPSSPLFGQGAFATRSSRDGGSQSSSTQGIPPMDPLMLRHMYGLQQQQQQQQNLAQGMANAFLFPDTAGAAPSGGTEPFDAQFPLNLYPMSNLTTGQAGAARTSGHSPGRSRQSDGVAPAGVPSSSRGTRNGNDSLSHQPPDGPMSSDSPSIARAALGTNRNRHPGSVVPQRSGSAPFVSEGTIARSTSTIEPEGRDSHTPTGSEGK